MDSIDVARQSIEAFNAGDWDRYRAMMGPDSVYDEPATQRHFEGADSILEVTREWKEAFPDAHGTIERAVAGDGGTVTLELIWEGTQDGPMHMPGGDLPPSHRHVRVSAAQILDIEGDHIKENHHYIDMAGLMAQLTATD